MDNKQISQQLLIGSIGSIIGTICYVIAVTFPTAPSISFILVTIWPFTAIVFSFSIYKYIAIDKQSISNQLAFLFTVIAFVLVYIMVSIQLGLKIGIGDAITNANSHEKDILALILSSTEWVHLGVDLAWDMFLGVSLFFLSLAIKGHDRFGIWWTIPMALFGLSLIVVNLYTFPYTPESKGVFDIGPLIGTFMIIFASRAVYIRFKVKKS